MTTGTSATQSAPKTASSPVVVHKLSHVVLEVGDLSASLDFWTRIMGFEVSDRNEKGLVFLHNGPDHHTIGLIESPGKIRPDPEAGVRVQHFAFEVHGGVDRLFEIRRFLRDNGVEITFEGRHGAGGNIDLAFRDPDGYMIELNCGMDQPNAEGRYRPPSQFRRANSLEEAVANPLPESW
jgi:catechol 2,3-dioxygenase-like lactoylglutathione lyase family enzyme